MFLEVAGVALRASNVEALRDAEDLGDFSHFALRDDPVSGVLVEIIQFENVAVQLLNGFFAYAGYKDFRAHAGYWVPGWAVAYSFNLIEVIADARTTAGVGEWGMCTEVRTEVLRPVEASRLLITVLEDAVEMSGVVVLYT